jgi:hypothetical protein
VVALYLRFGWDGSPSSLPYRTPWSAPRRAWFGAYDSYADIWVNVFGYLGLLAVVNAFTAEGRALMSRYWPYIALVLLQLVLALDTDRLLFFSFPVVLPLALFELKRMKDSLPDWFPFMGTTLVFCYLFLPGQLVAPLVIVVLARVLMEWRRARDA